MRDADKVFLETKASSYSQTASAIAAGTTAATNRVKAGMFLAPVVARNIVQTASLGH